MSFLPDTKAFSIYTACIGVVLALAVALVCIYGPCLAPPDDDDSSSVTPGELHELLEAATADDDCAEADDDSAIEEVTP